MMKFLMVLMTVFLMGVGGPGVVSAHDVTLQWDPNSEPDLAGYYIYQSTTPDNWSINYRLKDGNGVDIVIAVSTDPQAVITGLVRDTAYYWVVTAFDTESLESDWSNQVTKTFTAPDAPKGLRFWQEIVRRFKLLFGGLRVG